jgi:hypothetical protein
MGAMHIPALVTSSARREPPEPVVHVIYTAPAQTRASLRAASVLARDLGARLALLAPHVVPFPASLDKRAAPVSFIESNLVELAGESDLDIEVTVLLCRDREDTVRCRLPPESIVVIGRQRRWGPRSFSRLIRGLRRDGHHVVAIQADQSAAAVLVERGVRR